MNEITMDTVRDLIERHSDHISGNTREFYNGAYAEIADELNSRAERTCYIEGSYYDELMDECYTQLSCDHETSEYEPNYCPKCGARVVGRDD